MWKPRSYLWCRCEILQQEVFKPASLSIWQDRTQMLPKLMPMIQPSIHNLSPSHLTVNLTSWKGEMSGTGDGSLECWFRGEVKNLLWPAGFTGERAKWHCLRFLMLKDNMKLLILVLILRISSHSGHGTSYIIEELWSPTPRAPHYSTEKLMDSIGDFLFTDCVGVLKGVLKASMV